jgi:hypothetical protein
MIVFGVSVFEVRLDDLWTEGLKGGSIMRFVTDGGVRLCFILGAVILLGVSPAWGQAVTEGKLTGTVYLPTGEALAGATARVAGDALVRGEMAVVSGEGGRFVFLSLPPGTYDLTVSLDGFKTFTQEGIVVARGATFDVRVDMEMGAIEDVITVTAETPVINKHSATIDTTFGESLLAVVPTARESFYDLALTAAGMASVGHEGDKGWLTSASAYGGSGNENIFLVNGVDATNPRGAGWGAMVNVNYNTVEEVKVLSLGSKAEYGSFSGAAVDVITKSGGNDFHGDLAYYSVVDDADNNTSSFGKDWLWAPEGADLSTGIVDDWEANITVGGPIVRDRLWFYAGYSRVLSETDRPVFVPIEKGESDLYDLKLTAAFGTNHRLWIGYHHEDNFSGNESWGDKWDATMGYNNEPQNDTFSAQYQVVVTDASLISFKFLGFETEDKIGVIPLDGRPGFINWWKLVDANLGVAGEFPYSDTTQSERQTLQADVSHYADDFLGEHDVKFGVQYTEAQANFRGGYFHGYANFTYPTNWWYYNATWYGGIWGMYNRQNWVQPFLTVRKSDSTGAFMDDTWILSDRVTLNLGVRYDRMTAKYGEGAVYEFPDTPADIYGTDMVRTREGSGNVFDFKTWSPRLGIIWTITEDGKTVLRSHIGRYYAPIGLENLRRFGPDMAEFQQIYQWWDLPFDVVDANGDNWIDAEENREATRMLRDLPPDRVQDYGFQDPSWSLQVEPGTDSPYTDQFNLSIQRQIGRDFAIEASYIYKKTEDFMVLWPYNSATGEYWEWEGIPFTTWTGYDSSVFQIDLQDFNGDGAADWDDVVFFLNNTDYRVRNMKDVAGEGADRTYQGFQLVFNKRYSDRWQMVASLNWTDTDGVAPRPVDQNWYLDGPMMNDTPFGGTLNNFTNNLSGPMPMTPEFMFKLAGSYRIPTIETDFGLRIRHDSGRPIWPIQTLTAYAEWHGGFADGPIIDTGYHEFMVADDPNNPDWMPAKTIVDLSLNKTFTLGRAVDLGISLDVLNAFNEDTANKVGFFEWNYGQVEQLIRPRITRLGVKLSF